MESTLNKVLMQRRTAEYIMDFHYDFLPIELFLPFFKPYSPKINKKGNTWKVKICPFHELPQDSHSLKLYSSDNSNPVRGGFICFSCGAGGYAPLIPLLFMGFERGLEWLIENYPFPLNLSQDEKTHIRYRTLEDIRTECRMGESDFYRILTNPKGKNEEPLPLFNIP